jgi:hypothetical protein
VDNKRLPQKKKQKQHTTTENTVHNSGVNTATAVERKRAWLSNRPHAFVHASIESFIRRECYELIISPRTTTQATTTHPQPDFPPETQKRLRKSSERAEKITT